MDDLVRIFTEDMVSGLAGREGALRMIPTYIEADNDFRTDTPVLAIDAGGTNFRASLVTITGSGEIKMEDNVTTRMPGLDGEISSREFFSNIADNIRPLAEKTERIGFCFSYPTEIMPDRDGRLLQFCKEVQAPEVEGMLIGKNLLEALGTPRKKIVLLNDTVATLLAGKSASPGKMYDSFIGFILGTGTNTCYIEQNRYILKKNGMNSERSQIINIESGDFGRPPQTDMDILFDETTSNPHSYMFEKMFSGGYFGGLSLTVLKSAATEGVFSASAARALAELDELPSWEANSFAAGIKGETGVLNICIKDNEDVENCSSIINTLIDRAAKLVCANLAAVVLKTGKGKSSQRPVLITIEGTTFYKLQNFKSRFEKYFSTYMDGKKKRYVEFTGVDKSSLIGAALAGLTD